MGQRASHSGGSAEGRSRSWTLLASRTFRRTGREEHRAGTPSDDAEADEGSGSEITTTKQQTNHMCPRECCTNFRGAAPRGHSRPSRAGYFVFLQTMSSLFSRLINASTLPQQRLHCDLSERRIHLRTHTVLLSAYGP